MVLDFFRPKSEGENTRTAGSQLSHQFFVVAALVVTAAMLAFGTMMTGLLQQSVIRTAGHEWAGFLGAFLEPHVQDLAAGGGLSPAQLASLEAVFSEGRLSHTLVAVKVWSTDGRLLFTTTGSTVGETDNPSTVTTAASGTTVVQFEDPAEHGGTSEGDPLIEVYAPLHRTGTEEVVAVGELYENATGLVQELDDVRLITWAAVAMTSILITGLLYLIVRRAARTIDQQQADLNYRVDEAAQLAVQNNELRLAADKTRLDASEANEQLLGRIGADLHDGPVQLLSLVALSLTSKRQDTPRKSEEGEPDELRILKEALGELRNISAGLSLPEIGQVSLRQALELAVFRHEDLTGDRIVAKWGTLPDQASEALKICAYRVLQEGMANAHKHARGATIEVSARRDGGVIHLEVADSGGVETEIGANQGAQKLGLAGMRNRVTSLDGTLEIAARNPRGTRIIVTLPLEPAVAN